MKLLFLLVLTAACAAAPEPPAVTHHAPTDQGVCSRAWNPYGALPAECDRACEVPPETPTADPRTGALTCSGAEPCLDQPACKLAVNRQDSPRVDCAATFVDGSGVTGCCVETKIDAINRIEVFYACPL